MKAAVMRSILEKYESMGSYSRVQTAAWTHAVMLVEKTTNASTPDEFRLVHCLARLNDNFETITANFSIIDELPSRMSGMNTFAKIDILKCFDYFPLSEESRKYFAFLGPDGELWALNSVPQGYKNAPAIVHAQLRTILREAELPITTAAVNHMDDIMIGATDSSALWEGLMRILKLL
ncbi:MAG: hypothetical protein KVP17_003879, partial [Porospora cf. gigantea B]